MKTNRLTILTVSYGHKALLLENMRLSQLLHKDFLNDVEWHVAENSPIDHPERFTESEAGFYLHPGDGENDKGISHHHASALNNLLRTVNLNRYVLILDPDFFLLLPEWAKVIPDYMHSRALSFFGVPWHPRHHENYRYFPAVHCFAFDSHVIDRDSLDFTPQLDLLEWKEGRLAKLLTKIPVLGYRISRRSWDTGTRVWRRYSILSNKYEVVTPIYHPDPSFLTLKNRLIESLLPDWMCLLPKRTGYFDETSFEKRGWVNEQIPNNWEAFMWKDQPFGLHVRRSFAHHMRSEADELSKLPIILKSIITKVKLK
ncbi:hypothetical protein [Sulfuricystis thermophila]|uniref:hypothetical protein n=1 Tax=Sulfuricystis thermophila TaxID=2496847 RepID=UPI00103552DA|nr:hypothetical protein [Sulfuricystis thermophila]